jgi:Ca2+-binding RTX toxin-like protein
MLAVPGAASAAIVQALDTHITVSGEAGESSLLAVFPAPAAGVLRIQDPTGSVRAGFACTQVDDHTADCPSRPRPMTIDLLDGDDRLEVIAPVRVTVRGGDGRDTVTADGAGASSLSGEGGDDRLFGGVAADTLTGGPGQDILRGDVVRGSDGRVSVSTSSGGNDVLTGGPDTDSYEGGAGEDTVSYADLPFGISATLPRPLEEGPSDPGEGGENEQIPQDVENLTGGPGRDTLTGNRAANRLDGGGGDDTITGNRGADLLTGGAGGDTIFARDGFTDAISCGANGSGRGSQFLDVLDSDLVDGALPADCETIANGAVDEGPNVLISASTLLVRANGRVGVRLRCPRGVAIGCNGRLRLRLVGRSNPGSTVRGRAAARANGYRLAAGRSRVVRLRLTRRERARLRFQTGTARVTSVERGKLGRKTTVRTLRIARR